MRDMHPHTDIVVLVHNNLDVTVRFIKSLFENTSNFRLIIVDNGSKDTVGEYLKCGADEEKWDLITSETNLGVVKGRNLGAAHVKSDFMVNIDNDQLPLPGWLDALHNTISKGYDIVGCEAWLLSPPNTGSSVIIGNQSQKRDYYPVKRCVTKSDVFSYIGCGGMLIKSEIFRKVGLFDEQFSPSYFEDPDLAFRCIQSGYKLMWCPESKVNHLGHATLNTQKTFDKNKQFLKSWRLFQKKWHPYYPTPQRAI